MTQEAIYNTSLDDLGEQLQDRSLLDLFADTDGGDTYLPHQDAYIDQNLYVQKVLDIHFDEEHGAPYWKELNKELDFDPRAEISSLNDLDKLPAADEEALRNNDPDTFIPDLFKDEETYPSRFDISKSSGTTGQKKMLPWKDTVSDEIVDWYGHNLDTYNTGDGNWIICGPYGLYEKHLEAAAADQGGFGYFTGIETREFKTQMKELGNIMDNPFSILDPRKDTSVVEAAKGFMRTLPFMKVLKEEMMNRSFTNLASAPPVIDIMYDIMQENDTGTAPDDIDTIVISGSSITEDTVDSMQNDFPNASIVSMYATSFTGPAFDTIETDDITYYPPQPMIAFDVKDTDNPEKTVAENERGQVVIHRLTEDFLWPNQYERETAIRERPTIKFDWNGISNISGYDDYSS